MINKINQQKSTSSVVAKEEAKTKKMLNNENKEIKGKISKEDSSNNNQQKIRIPNFVAMESIFGAASLLATKSANHKYLFACDLEWLVMPAIALKQFALFRSAKNEPIAFVSWAFVSDEVEQRILNHTTKLQAQDWKSGNKAYIIDIISPLNIGIEILNELNEKQFKDKEVRLIRPRQDGKGLESKLLSDVIKEFSKKSTFSSTNKD